MEVVIKVKYWLFKFGISINEDKVMYNKEKVRFLGYDLKHNKVKPSHDRAEGINEFPIPTLKKMRKFIGMISWNNMFIKDL